MYTIRHSRIRQIEAGIKSMTVDQFMKQNIIPPKKVELEEKIGDLLNEVCDRHMVRAEDVLGKTKYRHVSEARQEFICLLHFRHKYLTGDIARLLDMDLTSVKHLLGLRSKSRFPYEVLREQFS